VEHALSILTRIFDEILEISESLLEFLKLNLLLVVMLEAVTIEMEEYRS
jgi:hypothetical protein